MKSKQMVTILVVLLVLAVCTNISFGREREITREFDAKELVKINTVSGDCIVEKGASDKITVRVLYRMDPDDSYEPRFKERGDVLKLSERFYGSSSGSATWEISVPEETEIDFSTASGELTIYDLKGEFSAETASGDVEVEDCEGEFEFNTASGDITLINCKGEFDLNTASGSIETDNCQGEFQLGTASGNIDADGVVMDHASDFSAASGSVRVRLADTPNEDLTVSTASGRAILDYGGNPIRGYFEFTARDRRGRIESPYDFDDEESFRRWGERYVRKTFTKGSGTPEVILETASGKIALREG
jgi:hypothetical protein